MGGGLAGPSELGAGEVANITTNGLGDISADDLIARINTHADLAVAQTRLDLQQGLISSSPQAFGTRAHLIFERLNLQLGSDLIDAGSDFRISAEEFRDVNGDLTFSHAPGSIGADVRITNVSDPNFNQVLDLKTFGTTPIPIGASRQNLFLQRFDSNAEEIYRQR